VTKSWTCVYKTYASTKDNIFIVFLGGEKITHESWPMFCLPCQKDPLLIHIQSDRKNKCWVWTMMRFPTKTVSSSDNDEVSNKNRGIFVTEICRRDDVFPTGNFAVNNFDSGHASPVSTSNPTTKTYTFLYSLFFFFPWSDSWRPCRAKRKCVPYVGYPITYTRDRRRLEQSSSGSHSTNLGNL